MIGLVLAACVVMMGLSIAKVGLWQLEREIVERESRQAPVQIENRACAIVTLDPDTLTVSRVGIYSCSAKSLTMASSKECHQ
jgi:hypothetical protein